MGTSRVKQEEEANTRIIVKEWYEKWKKGMDTIREKSATQGLTTAKGQEVPKENCLTLFICLIKS